MDGKYSMMKKLKTLQTLIFIFGIVAFLAVSGCTDTDANADIDPEMMENAPPIDSAHSTDVLDSMMGTQPSSLPSASGEVVETMNAAGYTYVKIDTGSGEIWAAGPETVVKVGDSVTVSGNIMTGFSSSSLNKTFDEIIFSNMIESTSAKQVVFPTYSELKDDPASYYLVELNGTINQTLDAGGYTYVELSDGAETVWVATYEANLSIGDFLTVAGTVNADFNSPTLNRTFDVLVLVPAVSGTGTTDSGSTGGASPHGGMPVN